MSKTHRLMLVIVAAAILLAIGAVSAYADLASDVTAPETTADVGVYWNTGTVDLAATDNEGVAYIYHELDDGVVRLTKVDGKPLSAGVEVPRDFVGALQPLTPGAHTLKFWAQDINGNVEAQKTVNFTVNEDTTAPVTTATGAKNGGWYNSHVTVSLAASDEVGGSGVEKLGYGWDVAPAMADGAAADAMLMVDAATLNGPHTLFYQAADIALNTETVKTLTVNIDTRKPGTLAPYAAAAARGKTATLKYKVTDQVPNAGKATVTIKVKNSGGKVVKTLTAGQVGVGSVKAKSFVVPRTWKAGTYKFFVYAKDLAGNTQSKIGSNKLVVR